MSEVDGHFTRVCFFTFSNILVQIYTFLFAFGIIESDVSSTDVLDIYALLLRFFIIYPLFCLPKKMCTHSQRHARLNDHIC